MKKVLVFLVVVFVALVVNSDNSRPISTNDVFRAIRVVQDVARDVIRSKSDKRAPRPIHDDRSSAINNSSRSIALTTEQLKQIIKNARNDGYTNGYKDGYRDGLKDGVKIQLKDEIKIEDQKK